MNQREIYTAIDAWQKAAHVKANWVERKKPADCGDGNLLIETNKKKHY